MVLKSPKISLGLIYQIFFHRLKSSLKQPFQTIQKCQYPKFSWLRPSTSTFNFFSPFDIHQSVFFASCSDIYCTEQWTPVWKGWQKWGRFSVCTPHLAAGCGVQGHSSGVQGEKKVYPWCAQIGNKYSRGARHDCT